MLEPVLSGIGFGLILAVMIGPVFFALLQTALHEGFRPAVHLAVGVLVSDVAWISLATFFASQLDLTVEYRFYTGWIGGCLLILFGASMIVKKIKVKNVDDNKSTVHARFVLQGFLLNSFNPGVPLFWLGVIGVLKLKDNYTIVHESIFLLSVLATVIATDLLKAYLAHRLKKILTPDILLWINRSVGAILIGIGSRMIVILYA